MKSPSYFPLVLAIVGGLLIGLLPSSSAFGGTLPACLNGSTTAPNVKFSVGGQAVNTACIVTLEHTVIVSPKSTAILGGDSLLSAMTLISNSNPSATNPWLLKVEPGLYDLNARALTLLPYVDMEGSGEETTVISSSIGSSSFPPSNATIIMSNTTELRSLKILNNGNSNTFQIAVLAPGNPTNVRLTYVNATASTGSSSNFSNGFEVISGTATIDNSILTGATISGVSTGAYNNGGTMTVNNSTIIGTGGNTVYGIYSYNGVTNLLNTNSTASGGTSNYGFLNNGSITTIQNSTLVGVTNSVNSFGTAKIGASQLNGPRTGTLVCAASYDGSFAALGSGC